jgi:hypothetical protein
VADKYRENPATDILPRAISSAFFRLQRRSAAAARANDGSGEGPEARGGTTRWLRDSLLATEAKNYTRDRLREDEMADGLASCIVIQYVLVSLDEFTKFLDKTQGGTSGVGCDHIASLL